MSLVEAPSSTRSPARKPISLDGPRDDGEPTRRRPRRAARSRRRRHRARRLRPLVRATSIAKSPGGRSSGTGPRPAICRPSTTSPSSSPPRARQQGVAVVHGDYRFGNCISIRRPGRSRPCSTGSCARSATPSPTSATSAPTGRRRRQAVATTTRRGAGGFGTTTTSSSATPSTAPVTCRGSTSTWRSSCGARRSSSRACTPATSAAPTAASNSAPSSTSCATRRSSSSSRPRPHSPLCAVRLPWTTEYDAVVIGSGPNGLVAAITIAAPVAACSWSRGSRRRAAEPAAPSSPNPASSRRLLGGPPARHRARRRCGRCPSIATGCAGSTRRPARPSARRPHGPVGPVGRGDQRPPRRRRQGVDRLLGRSSTAASASSTTCCRRSRSPTTRSRWPASGCTPCARRRRSPVIALRRPEAPALFAGAPCHPARSTGRSPPASGCSRRARTPGRLAAGRGRFAGDRRCPRRRAARHGGAVECGQADRRLDELPPSGSCSPTSPAHLVAIAGDRLPDRIASATSGSATDRRCSRSTTPLSDPVPWADPATSSTAATVHVGGTFDEIAAAEQAGRRAAVTQRRRSCSSPSRACSTTRAPAGRHTLWAYCHVPNGSTVDMTDRIEARSSASHPASATRSSPAGVRSPRRSRRATPTTSAATSPAGSPTCVSCSPARWCRCARGRPGRRAVPVLVVDPPGAGVHGMCGLYAALASLRRAARESADGSPDGAGQ